MWVRVPPPALMNAPLVTMRWINNDGCLSVLTLTKTPWTHGRAVSDMTFHRYPTHIDYLCLAPCLPESGLWKMEWDQGWREASTLYHAVQDPKVIPLLDLQTTLEDELIYG